MTRGRISGRYLLSRRSSPRGISNARRTAIVTIQNVIRPPRVFRGVTLPSFDGRKPVTVSVSRSRNSERFLGSNVLRRLDKMHRACLVRSRDFILGKAPLAPLYLLTFRKPLRRVELRILGRDPNCGRSLTVDLELIHD